MSNSYEYTALDVEPNADFREDIGAVSMLQESLHTLGAEIDLLEKRLSPILRQPELSDQTSKMPDAGSDLREMVRDLDGKRRLLTLILQRIDL